MNGKFRWARRLACVTGLVNQELLLLEIEDIEACVAELERIAASNQTR
jgi:hypothetical protein